VPRMPTVAGRGRGGGCSSQKGPQRRMGECSRCAAAGNVPTARHERLFGLLISPYSSWPDFYAGLGGRVEKSPFSTVLPYPRPRAPPRVNGARRAILPSRSSIPLIVFRAVCTAMRCRWAGYGHHPLQNRRPVDRFRRGRAVLPTTIPSPARAPFIAVASPAGAPLTTR